MTAVFDEKVNLFPRDATAALVLVFVATDIFIAICMAAGIGVDAIEFSAITIVFAAVMMIAVFVKIRITVTDNVLTVRFLKSRRISFENILDKVSGDSDDMRNYIGWGIKNVKHTNLICPGYEDSVAVKLIGRRILTVSTSRPEELMSALPDRKKD